MILNLLTLRLVIAPPLIITIEVLLFCIGVFLGVYGFYKTWKPKYILVDTEDKKKCLPSPDIFSVSENTAFNEDELLAKEAVALLAIKEADTELPNVILRDSDLSYEFVS